MIRHDMEEDWRNVRAVLEPPLPACPTVACLSQALQRSWRSVCTEYCSTAQLLSGTTHISF